MTHPRMLLVGVDLKNRSFNGGNQALPWLASALNNEGYRAKQFDMENPNNTLDALLREGEQSDFIGFCGTFSVQLDQIDEYANALRQHLVRVGKRDTPIVVGGYGSSQVKRYAEHAPFIDAFFYGPGIEEIVNIARTIQNRKPLSSSGIRGLSYFDRENNKFVQGAPASLPVPQNLANIDQLFDRDYIPSVHDIGDIFFDDDGKPLKTFQLITEMLSLVSPALYSPSFQETSRKTIHLAQPVRRRRPQFCRRHGHRSSISGQHTTGHNNHCSSHPPRDSPRTG